MMLKPLFAFLLLATPSVAAMSQSTAPQTIPAGQWRLASNTDNCMVHAASGKGTVLSIAASPDEQALLFIVQNTRLASLQDGEQYPVEVEFDDMGEWQIDAVAQRDLDQDGPGVIFAVRPGREDGANFIKEFAGASGMHIGREGVKMDSLPLQGAKPVMAQMAQCLGTLWSNASGTEEEKVFEGGGKAVKI
jgi:hypothetical protein